MKAWNWYASRIAVASAVAILGLSGIARAQTETPQSLILAVYDGEDGANNAYKAMKQSQKEGVIRIDSFAVVSKDPKGKVHVHSTQKRGAKAGAVIGALIGVLGGPAGVAIGAGAGGGLGYLTGEAVGIPQEDINTIKAALQPGTSALVAVVDDRWAADLERSMKETKAAQVLEHQIASPGQPSNQQGSPPAGKTEGSAPPHP
jgi:uncharacterized membrane protein